MVYFNELYIRFYRGSGVVGWGSITLSLAGSLRTFVIGCTDPYREPAYQSLKPEVGTAAEGPHLETPAETVETVATKAVETVHSYHRSYRS